MYALQTISKVRFILNNHLMYDTEDSLRHIMTYFNITPVDISTNMESLRYEPCRWWTDQKFMTVLATIGVSTIGMSI